MTTIVLFLVLGGICSFGFHAAFGKSWRTIPQYLLAGYGGAAIGYGMALLLDWQWWLVGGVPLFLTLAGAILFLALTSRLEDLRL